MRMEIIFAWLQKWEKTQSNAAVRGASLSDPLDGDVGFIVMYFELLYPGCQGLGGISADITGTSGTGRKMNWRNEPARRIKASNLTRIESRQVQRHHLPHFIFGKQC